MIRFGLHDGDGVIEFSVASHRTLLAGGEDSPVKGIPGKLHLVLDGRTNRIGLGETKNKWQIYFPLTRRNPPKSLFPVTLCATAAGGGDAANDAAVDVTVAVAVAEERIRKRWSTKFYMRFCRMGCV